MQTYIASVREVSESNVVICLEARASHAESARGRYTPIETHPAYVVIKREIRNYTWAELEAQAHAPPNRDQAKIFRRLLERARVLLERQRAQATPARALPSTMPPTPHIIDTEGSPVVPLLAPSSAPAVRRGTPWSYRTAATMIDKLLEAAQEPCSWCHGRGFVDVTPCSTCRSTGCDLGSRLSLVEKQLRGQKPNHRANVIDHLKAYKAWDALPEFAQRRILATLR